jgi:hypothetical protein
MHISTHSLKKNSLKMEKTTMQRLIDEIVEHLTYDDDLSEDSRITLETIRLRCIGKLEMEKEQIIDAFEMGRFNIDDMGLGEEYYNETFKKD